jgi:zinc protease
MRPTRKPLVKRLGRIALALGTFVVVVALPGQAQFPTEPPPATELEPLEFPPFQEATLENGLTVLVVEDHKLPIVSVRLSMRAGDRFDAPGSEGLADMVGELLTKGTERRTAEQIAEEIETVGASIFASAGSDFFNVYSTVLTDDVELAFDLMSDITLNSTFPEEELALARTRALSGLRLERSDPGALASRYFFRTLYGDHPYGRRATEESVERLTREAVAAWAATYLKPDGALLVLAGDISLADGRRLAERFFGSWTGSPPTMDAPAPPAPQPTAVLLVHRPGSDQSNIRVGNLALEVGDGRYYAATVGNKILGGGTDARLFMILREEKSWTYGAYSGMARRKDRGYFQANTEVRTSVTDSALTELLYQLDRIRTEPVSAEELQAAKGYLVGSFPLSIQTPQQIAGQVASVRLLGLGEDYLRSYRQRLDAVTSPQITEATQAVIKPDSAVVVVVGDGQALYDRLTAIAPVSIIDVDGEPLTPDDLTPEVTAMEFDASAIVAHRDSFQVLVQGNPFGTRVTEVAREGDEWVVTDRISIPMAGIQQQSTLRLDAATLAARSFEQTGEMQGQSGEIAVTYEGNRVFGTSRTPQPTGIREIAIDTTLADGTVDAEALEVLLAAMPLETGAEFTINTFDPADATVSPTTIEVAAVEEVTVAAGTFMAYRLDVSQDEEAMVMWVSQDAPRRIVKAEIVGQPVAFELVAGS